MLAGEKKLLAEPSWGKKKVIPLEKVTSHQESQEARLARASAVPGVRDQMAGPALAPLRINAGLFSWEQGRSKENI